MKTLNKIIEKMKPTPKSIKIFNNLYASTYISELGLDTFTLGHKDLHKHKIKYINQEIKEINREGLKAKQEEEKAIDNGTRHWSEEYRDKLRDRHDSWDLEYMARGKRKLLKEYNSKPLIERIFSRRKINRIKTAYEVLGLADRTNVHEERRKIGWEPKKEGTDVHPTKTELQEYLSFVRHN